MLVNCDFVFFLEPSKACMMSAFFSLCKFNFSTISCETTFLQLPPSMMRLQTFLLDVHLVWKILYLNQVAPSSIFVVFMALRMTNVSP